MAQFGADPSLAAQCPQVPAPDGWVPWSDASGPIPDALAQRAQTLAADQTVPLGATESYPLPGVVAMIRTEPRVWSRDASGNLIQGCFRSGVVYLPAGDSETVTPPTTDGWGKAAGVLTVVSLAVGTAATIHAWSQR